MPQIANPTVIQGNRYNVGGIFGQGGIAQNFLSPLVGAAAHALPEMLGMQSPEDEAKQLAVDAAKQAQGQKIYNDYLMGRTSKDEAQNILGKIGYDIESDKAALLPSAEDEMRAQAVKQAATASGYDLANHRYGDMGFNNNVDTLVGKQGPAPSQPGEEVPDFEVKSSAPVTSGVVEAAHPSTTPTGVEPTSPTEELMSVGMQKVEEKAPSFQPFPEPLGGDSNPVKVRPVDSFNLNEMQEQGPQYLQQFLTPDDGQQFNYKGLTRQQQQQAQVISNRLLGFSNMMKMYDSKEITKPEDLAKVNSMIRTTEKDVNQMVDWHNETTTGDINKIRTMGGLPTLAMDMKSLQMLSPAYIASLPAGSRGKVEERARQIADRLQQLNPFELKVVNDFAGKLGDESTKMLFDYQKEQARTGAMNAQTQQSYYATNVKDAQDQRELYLNKIPLMELEARKAILKAHSDKITSDIAAQNLGVEAAKIQQGYAKIANDLGIANNKNAVSLAAMEVSLRNNATNARVQMMGHTMTAMSAEQKRNQDMLNKVHANLGASKGLRERVAAAQAAQTDPDLEVRKQASETLQQVMQGNMGESASLLTQKAVDMKGLLQAFGIPIPVGINPTESSGQVAQMGATEIMRRASAEVDSFLKAGQTPPAEYLNLANHLKVTPTGDAMLDRSAYKTAEDTNVTKAGPAAAQDQDILEMMRMQAKVLKTIPSFDQWMRMDVTGGGFKNQNIQGFQDASRAKQFYNQMVDFHRRMNGQRK